MSNILKRLQTEIGVERRDLGDRDDRPQSLPSKLQLYKIRTTTKHLNCEISAELQQMVYKVLLKVKNVGVVVG